MVITILRGREGDSGRPARRLAAALRFGGEAGSSSWAGQSWRSLSASSPPPPSSHSSFFIFGGIFFKNGVMLPNAVSWLGSVVRANQAERAGPRLPAALGLRAEGEGLEALSFQL